MNGRYTFIIGTVAFSILLIVATALLMMDAISTSVFIVMTALSIVCLIAPVALSRNGSLTVDNGGIRISSSFLSEYISFDDIRQISSTDTLNPGIRVFGYGGIKNISGTYSNSTFGSYKTAADISIPLFIVIKTDKNTYVLNSKDEATTRSILEALKAGSEGKFVGSVMSSPAEIAKNKKTQRIIIAVTAIILAVVLAFVGWMMVIGDVDAEVYDDRVKIDATMMNETVYFDTVLSVELRDDVSYGARVGGLGNSKVLTGNFKNDEFGKYRLAIYKSTDLCIVIETLNKTVVFNLDSDESTRAMYDDILVKLGSFGDPFPSYGNAVTS